MALDCVQLNKVIFKDFLSNPVYSLSRAANWRNYCKTPVLVIYVPDGAATNWQDKDIRHDTHGGKMFEDDQDAKNLV